MAGGTQARLPDGRTAVVLAAAIAAGGYAAQVPAHASPPPAPEARRVEAPPKPLAAESQPWQPPPPRYRPCRDDGEYEAWFYRTFGSGYDLFHDGPDPARIRNLTGEPKAEAQRMLRRGLAACSWLAVQAIERAGWRDLVPDLERAVMASDPDFRAQAIRALKKLGSSHDFTDELIAILSSSSPKTRMTAAIAAGRFSLDRFRRPLLDRIRQDPSWLVRVHAAESLIALADLYPRELDDHPEIAAAVRGDLAETQSLAPIMGFPKPLSPDQRARLGRAADQLDAKIAARLSAGRCTKPAPVGTIDLHVIPIAERSIVSLTADEAVGPCERRLAFVAFLESPGGFARGRIGGASGDDSVKIEIDALPKPITVTYARATGVLTVGTFTLDTAKANVAVLSTSPNGVAARYQAKLDLTFQRHGRPATATGITLFDFRPEITTAVHTLLERTPELRGLVRGPAPPRDESTSHK